MSDQFRLGQCIGGMLAHVIPGACAGLNQSLVFQQVIGLEDRCRADGPGATRDPYGRDFSPGGQDAAANHFRDVGGEFFVTFHKRHRVDKAAS